jgi:membrane-associated protease RseP (regulator of RpoE activity)
MKGQRKKLPRKRRLARQRQVPAVPPNKRQRRLAAEFETGGSKTALSKTVAVRIASIPAAAILALAGICPPALARVIDHARGLCGWSGVRVDKMTQPVADSLGMTTPYGAIFRRPEPGSPAAKGKIEAGDVITAINGNALQSWRDFAPIIANHAPGTTVYFRTFRDGQLIDRAVILRSGKCSHRARKP